MAARGLRRPGLARARGFTLVELMITVAVAAVLLTVAVPSVEGFIDNQRVKTASYALYASLLYARSEALKRNGQVFVTPDDASDWSQGWAVTSVDKSYDACNINPADCLKIRAPLPRVDVAGGPNRLIYRRDGRTTSASSPTFALCDAKKSAGTPRRRIRVDLTGRPNIDYDGQCS